MYSKRRNIYYIEKGNGQVTPKFLSVLLISLWIVAYHRPPHPTIQLGLYLSVRRHHSTAHYLNDFGRAKLLQNRHYLIVEPALS